MQYWALQPCSRGSASHHGSKTISQRSLWPSTALTTDTHLPAGSRQPPTQCHPVEIKHLVSRYHACERRDPLSQSFGANRLAPVWRLEPITTIDMSWAGCSVNTAEMHAFPSGKKLFGASSDWRLVWRLFGASSVWRNRLAPVWRLWRKGLVWRLFGA